MTIRLLNSDESDIIERIANWYYNEWQTPKNKTIQRLSNSPSDELNAQFLAFENDELTGTVGLAKEINITKAHPHLAHLHPWIALLYVDQNHRRKGVATCLLQGIDSFACENNIPYLYLGTFTAESLYAKHGYQSIETVDYKNHHTQIMKKSFSD